MELTKGFVMGCHNLNILRDFLCQAIDQVDEKDKKIAELKDLYKDMDVTHTVHIAKMNAKLEEQESNIAEKDAEIRRLKRALWLTRGAVHKANRKAMYGLLQAYPLWEGRPAGLEVHKNIHRYDGYERKCRAKAEEYK